MGEAPQHVVGVISDTHGLVRPEVERALRGCDSIIHAGDVGGAEVIEKLSRIAPVVAVRGNMDVGPWAMRLPLTTTVEVGHFVLYALHESRTLDLDPAAAGLHAVISGHTHRPRIDLSDGVLFFNPGSAGPRRLDLPITVGRLLVFGSDLEPEIINLS